MMRKKGKNEHLFAMSNYGLIYQTKGGEICRGDGYDVSNGIQNITRAS